MFSEDQLDEVMTRVQANVMEIESALNPSVSASDKRKVVSESIGLLVEMEEKMRCQIGKQMDELNEFVEKNGESFSGDAWMDTIELLCELGARLESLDMLVRSLYTICPGHPAFAEYESPFSQ